MGGSPGLGVSETSFRQSARPTSRYIVPVGSTQPAPAALSSSGQNLPHHIEQSSISINCDAQLAESHFQAHSKAAFAEPCIQIFYHGGQQNSRGWGEDVGF